LRRQSLPSRFLQGQARRRLPHADVLPHGAPKASSRRVGRRSSRPPPLRLSPGKGPHLRQSQSRRPGAQALRALLRTAFRRSSCTGPRDLPASQTGSVACAHRQKASREESRISLEYIEEVARAYEHFFFRYSASDLLVINTSEIDFVERSDDLQQLLGRLQDPVKGTQYFLP